MEVLFSTPHGSHLYGTATPTSDHDFYQVVARMPIIYNIRPKRLARQDIRGLDDVLTIDLSTWLLLCHKGVPQALEAMFSERAEVDKIEHLRKSFRVGTAVLPTYLRTIKSFVYKGEHDRKFRRHAVRLALNARDIFATGRFDPTMTRFERGFIMGRAERYCDSTGWSDSDALSEDLRNIVFGVGD